MNSLRGGIIAVIVMLLLTNLSVAIGQGGLDVNFAQMSGALLNRRDEVHRPQQRRSPGQQNQRRYDYAQAQTSAGT